MNVRSPAQETPVLVRIRKLLLWTLIAGAAATMAELLLLGHDESAAQFIPLILLASGVVAGLIMLVAPTSSGLLLFKLLMVVFLGSGALGVGLHYRGNEEFELERQPSVRGWFLVTKTLKGATPVLAPGSMSLLGVVGLAFSYRHPLLRSTFTEEA